MNCSHATLGKNIRTLRNARGLSQEALAQDAQITQSHLGCIERGRGNPTVETLFSMVGEPIKVQMCVSIPQMAAMIRNGLSLAISFMHMAAVPNAWTNSPLPVVQKITMLIFGTTMMTKTKS